MNIGNVIRRTMLPVWNDAAKDCGVHLKGLDDREDFEFGLIGSPFGLGRLRFTDSPRVCIIDEEHKLEIHAEATYHKAVKSFLRSLAGYPALEDEENPPYIFRIIKNYKLNELSEVNELQDLLKF